VFKTYHSQKHKTQATGKLSHQAKARQINLGKLENTFFYLNWLKLKLILSTFIQIFKPFILFSVLYSQPKIRNFGVWHRTLSNTILFEVSHNAQQIVLGPTRIWYFSFLFIPSNQLVNKLSTLVGGIKLKKTWTAPHMNLAKWHSMTITLRNHSTIVVWS